LAEAPGGQGIDGFLRAVFMQNFALFGEQVAKVTGESVDHMERRTSAAETLLTDAVLDKYDTLIIISFDSQRPQVITPAETEALRGFLARPETMLFVCPHHDIGDTDDLPKDAALKRQTAEFAHHGDVTLPGQQRTGGFAVSLMAALGAPIRNRFGLRPAATEHGDPAPFHLADEDKQRLLTDVPYLNLHPHLPHYERLGAGETALEVLVRQVVDPGAPRTPWFLPAACSTPWCRRVRRRDSAG
jgi:hypothetical protein